ncbi:DUF4334 domain-containing protein [Brunnivagina elsteri]|uniref:DUF4334 domain-containing protein n=1 Tax=Brunnivagina elsteri CCALA 953 TaxID=987040 RepID=A0A2A2TBF7_9CYAN|nr:DUF4334 domain-containing protein [Calothrix elsteri]PAX51042.1 hypothetical protein CK510_26960 [Calothrix elsteri CCALA 953]
MEILQSYQSILETRKTTTEEALQLFDPLEPVDLDFMFGRWQGSEIDTSHPMNGMLASSGWYGKEFIDSETVHPLLFADDRNHIFKVAPNAIAMDWMLKIPAIQNDAFKPLLKLATSLQKTETSQARLRMMEYRGKVSATMVYDFLPINDSFRKIDDSSVLGIMDYKNLSEPFFFILRRVSNVDN